MLVFTESAHDPVKVRDCNLLLLEIFRVISENLEAFRDFVILKNGKSVSENGHRIQITVVQEK